MPLLNSGAVKVSNKQLNGSTLRLTTNLCDFNCLIWMWYMSTRSMVTQCHWEIFFPSYPLSQGPSSTWSALRWPSGASRRYLTRLFEPCSALHPWRRGERGAPCSEGETLLKHCTTSPWTTTTTSLWGWERKLASVSVHCWDCFLYIDVFSKWYWKQDRY